MSIVTNRRRTRGALNKVIEVSTETSANGCSLAADTLNTYPAGFFGGVYELMLDVESGDWKRRRGKQFVFNDMLQTKSEVEALGFSDLKFTSIANRCNSPVMKMTDRVFGSNLAYWTSPCQHQAVLNTVQYNDLATEVWTKCLADRGKGRANLLESLAEADQAFRMVGTPFENLSKLIKTFRRNGRRANGYERVSATSLGYIQFVSAEWLRFRYGLTPVINDVKAVMQALETGWNKDPVISTSRTSGQVQGSKVTPGVINSSTFKCDYLVSTTQAFTAKAYIYDRITKGIWNDLGFNIQNLTGLAWELTRYSFVVDWFVNVGDVIYANAPRVNYESLGGQLKMTDERSTLYAPAGVTNLLPADWTMVGDVSDTVQRTDTTIQRWTPDNTYRGFVVKSDFRFDNFNRAADAATIAIQWLRSIGFNRR